MVCMDVELLCSRGEYEVEKKMGWQRIDVWVMFAYSAICDDADSGAITETAGKKAERGKAEAGGGQPLKERRRLMLLTMGTALGQWTTATPEISRGCMPVCLAIVSAESPQRTAVGRVEAATPDSAASSWQPR